MKKILVFKVNQKRKGDFIKFRRKLFLNWEEENAWVYHGTGEGVWWKVGVLEGFYSNDVVYV
jgi:hypothetical protein